MWKANAEILYSLVLVSPTVWNLLIFIERKLYLALKLYNEPVTEKHLSTGVGFGSNLCFKTTLGFHQ